MPTVRLRHFFSKGSEEQTIAFREYMSNVVNAVYWEVAEVMENLRYSKCRSTASEGLVGISLLFRKLSLLFKMLKHVSTVKKVQRSLASAQSRQNNLIFAADNVAYMFEDFKARVRPTLNVERMLRLYKDHSLLYPRILGKGGMLDDYSEIDRLVRVYLLREKMWAFETFLEKGVLLIVSGSFSFKVTLCGDLRSPEWKLFDINRSNKVPFLGILPSHVGKLGTFTRRYSALENARSIYKRLVGDPFLKKLISGTQREFYLDYILGLRVVVKEERIVGIVTFPGGARYFNRDVLDGYEACVGEALRTTDPRATFTIGEKIRIGNNVFNTLSEMKEFLYSTMENRVFYNHFRNFRHVKNYKRRFLGRKNVLVWTYGGFFCVKLNRIREADGVEYVDVELVAGKELEEGCLRWEALYLHHRNRRTVLSNSRKCENASAGGGGEHTGMIRAEDLEGFVSRNFEGLSILPCLLFLDSRSIITLDGSIIIHIGAHKFEIGTQCAREDGRTHPVDGPRGLSELLLFHTNVTEMNTFLSVGAAESGYRIEIGECTFDVTFSGGLRVQCAENVFRGPARAGCVAKVLGCMQGICRRKMFPTFASLDYMVFDFAASGRGHVVLKSMDGDTFLVKRTEFTVSRLKCRDFDCRYMQCRADNAAFFEALWGGVHRKQVFPSRQSPEAGLWCDTRGL